jgi:competence protein ComEC
LVQSCNTAGKSNDLSYVLRISHAGRSILLTGDAESEAWKLMRLTYGRRLRADFLKASHHGRNSAYDPDAADLIAPEIVFVSVGRKPDTDASRKYREKCRRVASTRYHGNINLFLNDDGTWRWTVQRNWD